MKNRSEYTGDTDVHAVEIDDTAPERTHNFNDLMHAAASFIIALVVIFVALYMRGITRGVEVDARSAGAAIDWIMDVPSSVLQQMASFVIVIGVLIHLLVNREWMQSAVAVISLFCGYATVLALSLLFTKFGQPALLAAVTSPGEGSGSSVLPDIYAGIGAFLTVAGPRRVRSSVKWSWNLLYVVAVILVIVSWHSVIGVIISFTVGRIIGMVLRFTMGTYSKGLWGQQIVQAVQGIGLDLISLHRRQGTNNETGVLQTALDDDLTENSRIYDATDRAGVHYIISVLDAQPHNTGYWNQLLQVLRFSGVTMRLDRSANDATHHHLSMVLGLRNCGLAVPDAYGVVEGEESSVLVFRQDGTPRPIDLAHMSEDAAADFMRYLSRANDRGYTHRRITPDTLACLDDGTHIIAGWQNGDCASSSTNVAVDKVQLLVLCATLLGEETAIDVARRVWGDKTLLALTPFVQKVIIPAQTRTLPGWDKQLVSQMRERLTALAPSGDEAPAEPVTLARFNVKSFLSITLLIIAVAVIFTQLKPDEVIAAVTHANIWWALICLGCSMLAWAASGLTLGAFMDRNRRSPFSLFCSQAASGFTAVTMPAGVGPAFVNLQYLRKSGYTNTAATAIMSVTWVVQGATTIILLLFMGLFTGRNMFSGGVPTNTLVVVIGIIVLVLCAAMAIAPVRRLIITKYIPMLKSYARQLVDVLSQPRKLAWSVLGAVLLNAATGLGFWAALMAFGYHSNPIETTFVFLLANTLGSAMPTPGGLGAIEAALTFAFTSIGVPAAVALSSTLVYRVGFYWLRIPIGALALKWLNRNNLI